MRDQCWLDKKIDNSTYESFSIEKTDAIAQNIIEEMHDLFPNIQEVSTNATVRFVIVNNDDLKDEGFEILIDDKVSIQAQTTRGLLYGMYRFYQSVVLEEVKSLVSIPDQSIRMIDHWDNINGSIERGYAGASIFYQDNHFRRDFSLIRAYARLLASVGINALTLNNVNVHQIETRFVLEEFYPEIRMLSDIFAQFGIKTFLCVNFAAPKLAGGLETADPLAPEVIRFWETVTKNIYRAIPDFGGFVVKADSEGGHGPFFYGRDHAEGANMFARALEPYQGIVIWRCFVYNHKQDWRDRKTDRARAAYDHFKPLDGKFADNVILQIKLGPLDFQVREPVSPLFGALRNTNHMIEFQLTQEYTGQQKAVYFQVPVWKEVLDFDTKYDYSPSVVRELIKHNSPQPKHSGICAVGLVGMDQNWTGHKLAQSNLFAFGRMTWDNTLTSEKIADEWIRLTFALSKDGYDKVLDILSTSREVYALYTAPRGVGFMISPSQHHYGPSVNGYEYDRWGTYHFADRDGVGVDRTMNGTKYVEQYAKPRFEEYNQLSTCPDEFLLWFHHVPYHHVLHNGKTLIQDIYDTHFEGVARVEKFIEKWSSLQDEVDEVSYQNVSERLTEQLRVAIEWRDQINTYFYRMSGIKDQHGRMIYP